MNRLSSLLAVVILAGCASLHSPPANAGTLVLTWTNPTTNTDGSAIQTAQGQPEALQTWRIEVGTCGAGGAFGTKTAEFTRTRAVGGQPLTGATMNTAPGQSCARVFVANTAGGESDASNVVAKVIAPAVPSPPTNVQAS